MHVLIADNSRSILDLISNQVVKRGNTVTTFQDGQEVYDYLTGSQPFDILLTSLELPNVSGLELCWETSTIADNGASAYAIVMSSSSDVDTLVEALDSGADDFLTKPFLQQELNARLRAAERTVSNQTELIRLATKDDLTNICNRRNFFRRVEKKLMSLTAKKNSSLIIFDIDHLRHVNEKHGQDAGDCILIAIAEAVDNEKYILGRLGGEEFGIFLHEASTAKAEKISEAIRQKISNLSIPYKDQVLSVTISAGVCELHANKGIDAALKKARQALDAAKNDGRDKTVVWGSIEHQSSIEETTSVQGFDHINGKTQTTSHALKAAIM